MKHLHQFLKMLLCLARELADENGYRRYLESTGTQHSGSQWRQYIDRKHRRKFQNAKCC